MKPKNSITLLVFGIAIFASVATLFGIFSSDAVDVGRFTSIHGKQVDVYGKGMYKYMSAEVAIQGIAQDYVTLFIAIPVLLIALFKHRKGSKKGSFLLAGTSGYFFVTYLFYITMGAYNELFLVYAVLLGLSFFALLTTLFSFSPEDIDKDFNDNSTIKVVGIFLIVNSILIGIMWLGVVVPPLIDGTIYPVGLEHYTTLIVQGLDLGLLLPLSFVSGLFLLQKRKIGYLAGVTYIIFLAILMTALTAKVIAMMMHGVNVIPVIFIIPTINIITIVLSHRILKNISNKDDVISDKQKWLNISSPLEADNTE